MDNTTKTKWLFSKGFDLAVHHHPREGTFTVAVFKDCLALWRKEGFRSEAAAVHAARRWMATRNDPWAKLMKG